MSTNQPATQTVEAYCKEQAKLSDPYLDIQSIEPFFYFHSLSIWWWRGKKNIQKSCWSEPIDISVLLVLFFARIESQNSCIFSIQLHMMIARTASGWIFMCAILMLLMLVGVSLNKKKTANERETQCRTRKYNKNYKYMNAQFGRKMKPNGIRCFSVASKPLLRSTNMDLYN